MLYIKHQKSLPVESAWVTMPPVRLGRIPTGLGTADLFVTIEDENGPILRADLYADQSPFVNRDALIWGERGFVGFGNSVYVIDPKTPFSSVATLQTFTRRQNISWLRPAAACCVFRHSEMFCGRPQDLD